MTFSPDEYKLVYKDSPMFTQKDIEGKFLFNPKSKEDSTEQYGLVSKMYVLMKRLNQNYKEILLMDSGERDELFEMEMKLIEEENKEQNSK